MKDWSMRARVTSRLAAALCAALFVSNCLAGVFPANARDIRVLEAGADGDGSACADFRVTPESAKAFFAVAVRISMSDQHDLYDYAPCYARGTVSVGHETWYWEMRAAGIGMLRRPGKEPLLVADPSQQTKFP
jgi:hypothetical protein